MFDLRVDVVVCAVFLAEPLLAEPDEHRGLSVLGCSLILRPAERYLSRAPLLFEIVRKTHLVFALTCTVQRVVIHADETRGFLSGALDAAAVVHDGPVYDFTRAGHYAASRFSVSELKVSPVASSVASLPVNSCQRLTATSQYTGSSSIPRQPAPNCSHAMMAVPAPQNGS